MTWVWVLFACWTLCGVSFCCGWVLRSCFPFAGSRARAEDLAREQEQAEWRAQVARFNRGRG